MMIVSAPPPYARSFRPRRRGLSADRAQTVQLLRPQWSLAVDGPVLELDGLFGAVAPVVLDIGFGGGEGPHRHGRVTSSRVPHRGGGAHARGGESAGGRRRTRLAARARGGGRRARLPASAGAGVARRCAHLVPRPMAETQAAAPSPRAARCGRGAHRSAEHRWHPARGHRHRRVRAARRIGGGGRTAVARRRASPAGVAPAHPLRTTRCTPPVAPRPTSCTRESARCPPPATACSPLGDG